MAALIYGLFDPESGECRYVGKTVQPLKDRLRSHISMAIRHPGSRHVSSWIASVVCGGNRPEIAALEDDPDDWKEAETFWIASLRLAGCRLTNLTTGGEGCEGYKPTEEVRRKLSVAAKIQFSDPARRLKAAEYARAAWKSEEYVAKRNRTLAAVPLTEEYRKNQSDKKKALWATDEYREKVVSSQRKVDRTAIAKAFWQRPEYRERQKAARARRCES